LSESAGLGKGVAPAVAIDSEEEDQQASELALEIANINIHNILLRRGPGPGAAIYNMVGAPGRLHKRALSQRANTNTQQQRQLTATLADSQASLSSIPDTRVRCVVGHPP